MTQSLDSRLNDKHSGLISAVVVALASVWVFATCQTTSDPGHRTIAAGTLVDKYSVSVDSARHEFDSNDLVVEGYVLNVVSMPKNDDGEGMVLLGGERSSAKGVQCWFTRYESAEFVEVTPGSFITVKGTFNGEAGPALKFCKLFKRPARNDT
ncbi:MAG TPA: hypothetical protein VJV05_01000, partial [Pyrinomonadaceae bacterium]|nr:hypothetical protein [Pyrinomonadaceae bacterium]